MDNSNDYDAILDQNPPQSPGGAPANDYDHLIDSDKPMQKEAMASAAYVVKDAVPDRHAQVMKLAGQMSLPASIVDRNFEDLTKKQQIAGTDYDGIIEKTPEFASWLQKPDNAALAKDDHETLGNLESTVKEHTVMSQMYNALGAGLANLNVQLTKVPALAYDVSAIPQNAIDAAFGNPELQVKSPEWLNNNVLAQKYERDAKAFEANAPALGESVIQHIKDGKYSKAGQALAVQMVNGAPQLAALVVGSLTGYAEATMLGVGVTTAAGANTEAKKAPGATPLQSTTDAMAKGVIATEFSKLGTLGVLSSWESAIAKTAGKQVSKEVMKDFAKTLLYSVGRGTAQGGGMSLANDFADYITGVNPEAMTGSMERAVNQGFVMGATEPFMAVPGLASGAHERMQQARQTEMDQNFYKAMGPAAESTKLRKRLPEAQQELIAQITKDSPVENLYISPQAAEVYFQKKGLNPVEVMGELGVLPEYGKAKDTGTDIKIPMAKWVDKVVGTEHYQGLENDVKFSPEGLSVNELNAEHSRLKAEHEAAKPEPETTAEQSAAKVGDSVSQQLEAAGVHPVASKIYESGFHSLGERMGVDPQDLFNQFKLKITGPEGAEPQPLMNDKEQKTMNQPERLSRAQEQGFNTDKIYYHGTDADIKEFKTNPKGVNTYGEGVYFTGDGGHAPNYGKNVVPAYLRDENPINLGGTVTPSEHNLDGVYKTLGIEKLKLPTKQKLGPDGGAINNYRELLYSFQKTKDLKKSEATTALNAALREAGYTSINADHGTPGEIKNILDPKNIRHTEAAFEDGTSVNIYAQDGGEGDPRGQIHIGSDGINISILKGADASTFLHETGHFYLEVMNKLAGGEAAPEQIKEDFGKIREWLGAKAGEEISVEQHEQFARGFEAYLMEGKAPSEGLRKAFASFKVWLTNIYKKMRSLNVELSPEIRGVYDRILATDKEISEAQIRQNYKPLFSEPAMYKLSPDDFAKYQSAIDAAKLAADDTLRAKVMKDITQTETAMYKEQETRVRGEIETQANQTRVFKAKALLQLDKLPDGSPRPEGSPKLKMDREGLVRAYGKEILEKLPRMYGREGAMDHNLVAEMLGYESGDHMIQELVNSPTKQDYVEQQTKARMEDMHPDLLSSGKMPDEAMAAIHSDQQGKVLRMELEFLARNNMPELKGMIKKVAKRVPTDQEVRASAEKTIGAANVRDLKPGQYKAAEARHAREAGEKLASGDFDGAFESKRLELYNHELFQAVTEAKEEVDKAMKDFRKMARKSDEDLSKTRDTNLVAAARATLAAFGIGTSEQPPAAYLEKLKRYDPENYAAAHALVEMATADGAGNFSEVPYDRFIAMRDTVKGIWDLARTSQQITIDGRKMAKQQVLDGLNARISDLSPTGPRPGYEKSATAWEKTKIQLMSWKAAGRRVESWVTAMDGGHKGQFRDAIWNPITEAATKFRLAKSDLLKEYLENIVKPVEDTFNKRVIDAPEINYQFKNKSQLLGALLHTGNESNFSKLLRGRNWGTADEQGNVDASRWNKMIERMQKDGTLTKKDYDYVQGVWDMYEKTKVGAQQAHKEMYGYYFNEITAKEFKTPFGEYKGGYAPAIADPTLSEDAQIRLDKEQIEKNQNSFMFPTTGRGFTKSRVEAYAAPLAIDLEYVPMQIDKVLRFTHVEPSVKEVGRLINDKAFRQTLSGLDPVVASEMLVPWLQRSAQQQTSTPSQGKAWKGFDYVMRKARGNTGMNAMVGNLVNVLHQFTGLPMILTRVEGAHFRDALWGYMKDARGTTEMMNEKSDYMRAKESDIAGIQSDINDIIMNPSKYDQVTGFIKQNGFVLQRLAAGMVDNIAWQSAYRQSTEKGLSEKESVRFADSVVRETQHSSNPEEISRFGTGSPFMRAFTMYFDYYNMKANLLGTEAGNIYREMGMIKGFPQLSYLYATGFMLPAVMAASFYRLSSGRLDENDDHKYMDDVMKIFFGGQLSDGLALLPVVGPVVNNFINRFNDNKADDRLSVSPVFKNLERVLGTPKEVYEALHNPNHKRSGAIRDSMSLLGMFTGLPLEPLSRPLGYLSDVKQGVAHPTGPIDYTRGLLTGQSGAPHKK